MLNDVKRFSKVYLACGYTDLRLGIDGLSCLVQEQFQLNPFTTHTLFMFCGRKSDRIKCLLLEEDVFLLLYKRLGAGRFQWSRTENDVLSITHEQFQWLMQGLAIEQKKVIPKVTPTKSL